MTLTDQIKKITTSKPFCAVAGAGGYAVDNVRTLRVRLRKQLRARRDEVRKNAGTTATRASRVYDDLAARGRKVVTRVSHETAQGLKEVSATAEPEPVSREDKAPDSKATPRAKRPTRA
ncbi:hypothetical protein [Nonomuraea sp. JJY05]|jgi:hypothetical protein|uniref:hypothetical protein n=1 Tax=Nonomuraea sp. JJY05 TaxID=3350255 RepID=UPI00373F7317